MQRPHMDALKLQRYRRGVGIVLSCGVSVSRTLSAILVLVFLSSEQGQAKH